MADMREMTALTIRAAALGAMLKYMEIASQGPPRFDDMRKTIKVFEYYIMTGDLKQYTDISGADNDT